MSSAELVCLALTVYFEARGESVYGQTAVARTVLNRVIDKRYPDTICEVVYQGGEGLNECQFSWYCDGRPDRPREAAAWDKALYVARRTLRYRNVPSLPGVTHYHAVYVQPHWAAGMEYVRTVGKHRFYR